MTYVPHFPATIRWAIPHTILTDEAVEGQVGNTMTFCGTEVIITKAWVEDGDMMLTIEEVQPFFERLHDVEAVLHEANKIVTDPDGFEYAPHEEQPKS